MTRDSARLSISTRQDPHAQARGAREQPVLLHSLSLFHEVFEEIYRQVPVNTVVEVGVESGAVSGEYVRLGAQKVYAVDPSCTPEVLARLAEEDGVELVEEPSPGALDALPVADLYVLDGDHNYATVHGEMTWILDRAPDAVVVLHDVLWPCGRRDFYYQPSELSESQRHADSDDGPTVWHDDLTPGGFVGLGSFTCAVEAGGEENGVLTAVEDAVAASADGWDLHVVPAVFGLGIVIRSDHPAAASLRRGLAPWTGSRLLGALENNRLALYTRVLELQATCVAAAEHQARLAEMVAEREKALAAKDGDLREMSDLLARSRESVAMGVTRRPLRRRIPAAGLRTARRLLRRP